MLLFLVASISKQQLVRSKFSLLNHFFFSWSLIIVLKRKRVPGCPWLLLAGVAVGAALLPSTRCCLPALPVQGARVLTPAHTAAALPELKKEVKQHDFKCWSKSLGICLAFLWEGGQAQGASFWPLFCTTPNVLSRTLYRRVSSASRVLVGLWKSETDAES